MAADHQAEAALRRQLDAEHQGALSYGQVGRKSVVLLDSAEDGEHLFDDLFLFLDAGSNEHGNVHVCGP